LTGTLTALMTHRKLLSRVGALGSESRTLEPSQMFGTLRKRLYQVLFESETVVQEYLQTRTSIKPDKVVVDRPSQILGVHQLASVDVSLRTDQFLKMVGLKREDYNETKGHEAFLCVVLRQFLMAQQEMKQPHQRHMNESNLEVYILLYLSRKKYPMKSPVEQADSQKQKWLAAAVDMSTTFQHVLQLVDMLLCAHMCRGDFFATEGSPAFGGAIDMLDFFDGPDYLVLFDQMCGFRKNQVSRSDRMSLLFENTEDVSRDLDRIKSIVVEGLSDPYKYDPVVDKVDNKKKKGVQKKAVATGSKNVFDILSGMDE